MGEHLSESTAHSDYFEPSVKYLKIQPQVFGNDKTSVSYLYVSSATHGSDNPAGVCQGALTLLEHF